MPFSFLIPKSHLLFRHSLPPLFFIKSILPSSHRLSSQAHLWWRIEQRIPSSASVLRGSRIRTMIRSTGTALRKPVRLHLFNFFGADSLVICNYLFINLFVYFICLFIYLFINFFFIFYILFFIYLSFLFINSFKVDEFVCENFWGMYLIQFATLHFSLWFRYGHGCIQLQVIFFWKKSRTSWSGHWYGCFVFVYIFCSQCVFFFFCLEFPALGFYAI